MTDKVEPIAIVVLEVVFGGVTLRVEHDGADVTLVTSDGEHLLGTRAEASRLAAALVHAGPRARGA
jgi:hypothetical protein